MTTSARHCPRVIAATDDGQALIVCGKPRPCPDHTDTAGVTVPVAGGLVEFPAELSVRVALDATQADASLAPAELSVRVALDATQADASLAIAGAAFVRLQAAVDEAVGRNIRSALRVLANENLPAQARYAILCLAALGEATVTQVLSLMELHGHDDPVRNLDHRWLTDVLLELAEEDPTGVVTHRTSPDGTEELWRVVPA